MSDWWKKSVVYQIYPRSFQDSNGDGIGDLNGITSRLDYLKALGVDVLWISPFYKSPGFDNGYDISDYRAIGEDFGSMEDFDRLLSEAHSRGLRIVLDLVVNHSSCLHPWFVESRKSRDNPKRDYYIWRDGKDGNPPNNWGGTFGGSAWDYDQATGQYYLHMFAKEQPDLNWENPAVRREVYDMMEWWCPKGIDGFRMDVISMISKHPGLPDGEKHGGLYGDAGPYVFNGPKVHDYLQEMNREVLSLHDLMTVGETAGVTLEEAKKYARADGSELSMVFEFEHVEIGNGPLGKWTEERFSLKELRAVISRWQEGLEGVAWNSLYWSNHDQPRAVSRFGSEKEEHRVLSAKMLATCLHLLKGTPYIYQGEELGMTGAGFTRLEQYRDVESLHMYEELTGAGLISEERMLRCLGLRSRDNARTPMQWDASPQAGFTGGAPWIEVNPNHSYINAQNPVNDPDSVFSYYKRLIALRHGMELIVEGGYRLLDGESDCFWAYEREYQGKRLRVLCNFTGETAACPLHDPEGGKPLISNYEAHSAKLLQPYEAAAYLL